MGIATSNRGITTSSEKLLGTKGIATRSKKLLVAPGIATSSKDSFSVSLKLLSKAFSVNCSEPNSAVEGPGKAQPLELCGGGSSKRRNR